MALDPFELSADGRTPGADECAGETHQKQADSFLAGVVDKEGDHLIGSAHRRRGWQESADHPEAEKEHHHQQRSCPDQQPLAATLDRVAVSSGISMLCLPRRLGSRSDFSHEKHGTTACPPLARV